jgi:hypothetical protein
MSAPATTALKQELLAVEKKTRDAWKARDAAAS